MYKRQLKATVREGNLKDLKKQVRACSVRTAVYALIRKALSVYKLAAAHGQTSKMLSQKQSKLKGLEKRVPRVGATVFWLDKQDIIAGTLEGSQEAAEVRL